MMLCFARLCNGSYAHDAEQHLMHCECNLLLAKAWSRVEGVRFGGVAVDVPFAVPSDALRP
jgi:hypothetical protein